MLSKIEKYLVTNELQFGFKKGIGSSYAVYALQTAVNFCCNRGSNVYVAALDASKAFDRINYN